MKARSILHGVIVAIALGLAPMASAELIPNPGFDDLGGGSFGEGWGNWGNTSFNDFWSGNPHASFFSDGNGNYGGVYYQGIAGTPLAEYKFELTNVRIEANTNANYEFGLEFFEGDDATQVGSVFTPINLGTTGDGLYFSMTTIAPAGTVYVRPVIKFDNAVSAGAGQENVFVFTTALNVGTGADQHLRADAGPAPDTCTTPIGCRRIIAGGETRTGASRRDSEGY